MAAWSVNLTNFFSPWGSKADVLSENIQSIVIDDYDDPNIDPTAFALEDESPYPEVRSAVSNTDDPSMPSSTFRAWVVGLTWAILIPGVNQFFFFRYPSVGINSVSRFFVLWHLNRFLSPVTESSPSRKVCPPAVDFPHLQSLGSLSP